MRKSESHCLESWKVGDWLWQIFPEAQAGSHVNWCCWGKLCSSFHHHYWTTLDLIMSQSWTFMIDRESLTSSKCKHIFSTITAQTELKSESEIILCIVWNSHFPLLKTLFLLAEIFQKYWTFFIQQTFPIKLIDIK